MRACAALVLVLALAGVAAAADDDEQARDTPPPGGAIPERMRALEREWDHDVGAPAHEADDETLVEPPVPPDAETEGEGRPERAVGADGEAPVAAPKPPPVEHVAPPRRAGGSPAARSGDDGARAKPPASPSPGAKSALERPPREEAE